MGRLSANRRAVSNRELQVAAAVAREAIVQLHVEHALDLVRLADGQVPALRMLDIYIRMQHLTATAGEAVANRVLAALGHAGAGGGTGADGFRAAQHGSEDDLSLLQMIRRRLRGRVHLTLRRAVELRSGVTRAALLEIHVSHACGLVRQLAETHSIQQACAVYSGLVPMPAPLAAVLYTLVLDRIAAEEAPAAWTGATSDAAAHAAREPRLAARGARREKLARTSA